MKGLEVPNPDSKQYNQNKQIGRALAQKLFDNSRGPPLTFD